MNPKGFELKIIFPLQLSHITVFRFISIFTVLPQPGNFEHAVEDITKYIDPIVDGEVLSTWLLAE